MRLCTVSVDIDEAWCYAGIHGMPAPREQPIYRQALPRMLDLFAERNIAATFFVVGKDLEDSTNAQEVRGISDDGHEVANHTYSHLYAFSRQNQSVIHDEIARGTAQIKKVTGIAPRGFRAPGYTINQKVFTELALAKYVYDSSVFPCPSYFAAKATAIGLIKARGRSSQSIIDDPRVLTASANPYRIGSPYWRSASASSSAGILEIPIGVTSSWTGRLPFIGTSLILAGETGARTLAKQMVGRPVVNLELHAIDLADAETDGLQWLHWHQPDLRKSLREKRRALTAAMSVLKDAGYAFVTTLQAAQEYAAKS